MDLRPCPFCGNNPRWYVYATLSGVKCDSCDFSVYSHGPESDEQKVDGVIWHEAMCSGWNVRLGEGLPATPCKNVIAA